MIYVNFENISHSDLTQYCDALRGLDGFEFVSSTEFVGGVTHMIGTYKGLMIDFVRFGQGESYFGVVKEE